MTEEQTQALIEDCKREMAELEKSLLTWGEVWVPYLQSKLKRQQIALAALTAQPVKLPDNVPCKGAPQFVWLQVSCDTGNPSEWPEHPEAGVTWHTEQIHSDDVLYIRSNSDEVQE